MRKASQSEFYKTPNLRLNVSPRKKSKGRKKSEGRTKPKVFLTHTWVKDKKGRDNHQRVKSLNDQLKASGIDTCVVHVVYADR